MPPGERWTGAACWTKHAATNQHRVHWKTTAVDLGSELLCCNHTWQSLHLHWFLNFDKCDGRLCAELTLSNLDSQTNALDAPAQELVVNKRWSFIPFPQRKILSTTTEGHERLDRARDRFAQVAKEPGVMGARDIALRAKGGSLSRHQHRVFEATTRKEAAVAAVRRCRLRHRLLNHRHLQNGVWNRRPK